MENMVSIDPDLWSGRSVFLTGHTGFKGSWLALWLHQLGAKVHGYAIDPPTEPSFFEAASISSIFESETRAGITESNTLTEMIRAAAPVVIFHLAAQSLVRESYRDPIGTLMTNAMGTACVLEAARHCPTVQAIVIVTTDKVYDNRECAYIYREVDPLGGHDLYSASKAAAEIISSAYRSSFFNRPGGHPAHVATVRAGNVIGGGDWAVDRLVPDCLRAFTGGHPVRLRSPSAMRPWQHVLEPLSGYIQLAQRLLSHGGCQFARAWNFGPDSSANVTVEEVATLTAELWGGTARVICESSDSEHPHEANLLSLDSALARSALQWSPRWSLKEALENTVEWHKSWIAGADLKWIAQSQIDSHQRPPGS